MGQYKRFILVCFVATIATSLVWWLTSDPAPRGGDRTRITLDDGVSLEGEVASYSGGHYRLVDDDGAIHEISPQDVREVVFPRSYAVIVAGASKGQPYSTWYWKAVNELNRVLQDHYGYSREAIYMLYEHVEIGHVDGQATLVNFRKVFAHLAKVMGPNDQLLVFLIGHGGSAQGHSFYSLVGDNLLDSEMGELLGALPSRDVGLVVSPCRMGRFIDRCAAEGRVIISSTHHDEGNRAAFAEPFINALRGASGADGDSDGRVSLKEAYDFTLTKVVDWYHQRELTLAEHALLDDDGDGRGHYGPGVIDGEGERASRFFLGAGGKKLAPSPGFVRWLTKRNAELVLDQGR